MSSVADLRYYRCDDKNWTQSSDKKKYYVGTLQNVTKLQNKLFNRLSKLIKSNDILKVMLSNRPEKIENISNYAKYCNEKMKKHDNFEEDFHEENAYPEKIIKKHFEIFNGRNNNFSSPTLNLLDMLIKNNDETWEFEKELALWNNDILETSLDGAKEKADLVLKEFNLLHSNLLRISVQNVLIIRNLKRKLRKLLSTVSYAYELETIKAYEKEYVKHLYKVLNNLEKRKNEHSFSISLRVKNASKNDLFKETCVAEDFSLKRNDVPKKETKTLLKEKCKSQEIIIKKRKEKKITNEEE